MSKEASTPKIMARCKVCHGSGVLPGNCKDDELLPCPTCKGKGVILHKVSKKHTEQIPCDNPNCHEGYVKQVEKIDGREIIVEKKCPVCEGYGVAYRQIVETTTECEECPTCEGRATVSAAEMRRRNIEDFCPTCHGTGYQIERKVAKRMALIGACTFLYPTATVAAVGGLFMAKSVKASIKAGKANKKGSSDKVENKTANIDSLK